MHKITKGIKKKIKSKKGNKGDDLFDPAELEKYRQEKAAAADSAAAEATGETAEEPKDEEWQRFKALTAGVDSILKKSQGDLDRIKSTSYFQRKAPGVAKEPCVEVPKAPKQPNKRWVGFEEGAAAEESSDEEVKEEEVKDEEKEEVKEEAEEEEEPEEEEDIFDTSYVDVVASGEVKLAYIPESPTEEGPAEDDPFDTSIAEKVIGPEEKGKKKQVVSLGCAVDVLTGRIDKNQVLPSVSQSSKKRRVAKRPEEVDLFILDEELDANPPGSEVSSPSAAADPFGALEGNGITTPLGEALPIPPQQTKDTAKDEEVVVLKDVVAEFDLIDKVDARDTLCVEDEEEDEFAALAAESARKSASTPIQEKEEDPFDTSAAAGVLEEFPSVTVVSDVDVLLGGEVSPLQPSSFPPPRPPPPPSAFVPSLGQPPLTYSETAIEEITRDLDSRLEADPFDTSFVESVAAPCRVELRLIESEILADEEDFDPRAEEEVVSTVKIHISVPAGEEKDQLGIEEKDFPSSLQPSHRDLLGGSTTDLSKLGHEPITPNEASEEEISEYGDPFDTSIVDPKIAPGKAELKIIEKELLGEVEDVLRRSLSDPDFDPRDEEGKDGEEQEGPAFIETIKEEAVASPSTRPDLLLVGEDIQVEFSKPLTPLVEDGERVEEAELRTDGVDPFDTSFAENILPGKAELRIIENELFGGPDVTSAVTRSLSDPDFDPRESESKRRYSAFEQRAPPPTSLPLQNIANPAECTVTENQPDLLAVEEEAETAVKPLSPAIAAVEEVEDPFDTSTVSVEVLKPGKAELKILESELIESKEEVPQEVPVNARVQALVSLQYCSAPPTAPKVSSPESLHPDLLKEIEEAPGPKPLTPLVESSTEENDFDPFDTSIAEGIGPGRTELKLLESELIGQ